MIKDIQAFHEKFGLSQSGEPRMLDLEQSMFRVTCLKEEVAEFEEAMQRGDLVESFDALIDLVYFALGTAHLMNLPFEEGWKRVHEANMAKVRAELASDSKRGSAYDVVKPAGWKAPTLDDLVNR